MRLIQKLILCLAIAVPVLGDGPKIAGREFTEWLNDFLDTSSLLPKNEGIATSLTVVGSITNFAKAEITTTTLSGSSITLDWTAGGEYRHTMAADTTLSFANSTGTNRTIVLNAYPDGTHSYTWPSGVIPLTLTNQPLSQGLTKIYFDRIDGTNYLSVSPEPRKDRMLFTGLQFSDGIGAVPNTNDYTAVTFMHYKFSGTAATNANYGVYPIVPVPDNLNTNVALRARLTVRLSGTDTDPSTWNLGVQNVSNSASGSFGGAGNWVSITMSGDASGAANDLERSSWVTLTGWAGALTAGQSMFVVLNRNGASDTSNVGVWDVNLELEYGIQ